MRFSGVLRIIDKDRARLGTAVATKKRPVECRSLYEMLCSLYLDEAENHFAFLGDHVLIPWWIPDDVDFRVGNARNTE